MKRITNQTKKREDALKIISHLILTKPVAVRKLLARHGTRFNFAPGRRALINEVVEQLQQQDRAFVKDFDRLLAQHMNNRGMELVLLESQRRLEALGEDEFLGGLGGVLKGALSSVTGMLGGGGGAPRAGGGGGSTQQSNAEAERLKAEMEQKMKQLEEDRRRMREDEERRKREAEARQRRADEERRRQQEVENQKRLLESMSASAKSEDKSNNTNWMFFGGLALLVVVIGGIAALNTGKTAVQRTA